MDPPESPPAPAWLPSFADGSLFEDSPVFDFINSLSPIATPKPLDSALNVQLFKSLDLVPVSSIFTSPQVHPQKESKPGIRAGYVQLSQGLSPNCQRNEIEISRCIEVSGSSAIASGNCSPSEDAAILRSKWPQSILLVSETLGDAKKQDIDGKADHSANMGQVKLSSTCYDQNGVDQMDLSTSVRSVQDNKLDKQYNDDLAACSLNHQISHTSNVGGVVSKSGLSLEAHQLSWILRNDNVISSKSFIPMYQRNSEDSRTKHFDGSTGCYIESATDDAHVYCAGAAEGVVMNHDPEMLPGVIQSQLVSNEYSVGTFKVPSDDMALSDYQCGGMHRRNLFNEKAGTSDMSLQSGSNLHHANICGDTYVKPPQPSVCEMPGIGLHPNALVSNSSSNMPFTINPPLPPEHNSPTTIVSCSETGLYSREVYMHDDHSTQKTMPNADVSSQESHKKKRRKVRQDGDGDSCRRCSCKKSKCLKLYCACFAAKVYCSGFCSCQGCLNNHTHEETVSSIRLRTESRNPLAFAPTVTHTCGSGSDFGDDSNKTPASARHKRGCNCRKSSCLKKYCECFQSGVGCSISCRCQSCKNSFGKREGVLLLATEKMEKGAKAKGTHSKEEKLAFDKQHVVGQSGDLPSTENLLAAPSLEPCRSSIVHASIYSEPPLSTAGCSSQLHTSQSPIKAATLLSPFETCAAKMILRDDSSNIQEVSSSCITSIKVVSPNKKRVSPLHTGIRLSPIGSGRKLVLKSIPSFPSLSGDADNEPR